MLAFPARRPLRLLAALLLLVTALGALSVSAASAAPQAQTAAVRAAAARVNRTARAQHAAEHRLTAAKRALRSCERRHRGACSAQRRAVRLANRRLKEARRRSRIAREQARRASTTSTPVPAPTITVNGQTLTWTAVSNVNRYVFVTKVPGLADAYSTVKGTSITPPAVPGQTVKYSVRADVKGSLWAPEVSIAYPSTTSTSTGTSTTSVDLLAAPQLTVSGQTLTWTQIGTVTSYVMVTKVPGLADAYSTVSGTSITPPAVPGQTVQYSVRTNVSGSLWAPQVAITYPATTSTTSPTPAPSPSPTPVTGSFQMGVVSGSAPLYQLPWLQQLGAHTARMEFDIDTPASNMASIMDGYARAGIRPLLLASFYGRLPTDAEAQSLASWAAAYGPGGTFWQGKTYATTPGVQDIEFGNETSYSYQFSDNSLSTYAARAQSYARLAKEAAQAIHAANPNVGLLAIGDNAVNQDAWVVNMFKAVPDLGSYVAGWTIHPYGPNWATRMDSTVNSTAAAGSPVRPLWVTEYGLATDNGNCLDSNYGWDKCMTYDEAATTIHGVLSGMQTRYGSQLGAFFLYQGNDQQATGTSTSREAYFGALQKLGAPKGAYTSEVMADLAAN